MSSSKPALAISVSIFALGLALPGVSSAENLVHTDLHGVFTYVGGRSQLTARDRTIDNVVGRMNVIIRPFAASKLREICEVPRRLVVQSEQERVGIALQPLPLRTSTVDGRVTRYTSTVGRPAAMRRVVRGNALVETVTTPRGQRVIAYRLSNDGSTLRLRWSLRSERHLPTPVTYNLTYRRSS